MKQQSNSLYIVSTPIGNLDDITLRAIEILKNSDIIICEDTRRSLKLLNHFKIKKKLISCYKFNEKKRLLELIKHIKEGKILSLVSDAGTPLLSDPGRLLLNKCIEDGINIIPIPGASAITSAMSVSGFSDQFLFFGFLPKTKNELNKVLKDLSNNPFSMVFFVPAIKVNYYLESFKRYFSGRKIMIAREITKIYESFFRGEINNLNMFQKPLKGELTVVISEKNYKIRYLDDKIINIKAKKYLKKYSLKDTVDLIFQSEKVNKKKIYQLCLKIKNEKNN